RARISPPTSVAARRDARKLRVAAMTSFTSQTALSGGAEPEDVGSTLVSAGLFEVLGVRPELGRGFVPADEQEDEPRVAVISHGLWQRRFGGDAGALGRPMGVDGRGGTLVGGVPAGFPLPPGAGGRAPLAPPRPQAPGRRFHL